MDYLSSKLSLIYIESFNINRLIKVFTFLSTLPVWEQEYPVSFQSKLVSSSFKWLS